MKTLNLLLAITFLIILNFSCKVDPNAECICPVNIDPVCGDDGVEYSNSCQADCVGVSYTQGSCSIETTARMIFLGEPALDGCGWIIRFDVDGNSQDHKTDSVIDSTFLVDELEVSLVYQPTLLNITACFAPTEYPLIEVVSID